MSRPSISGRSRPTWIRRLAAGRRGLERSLNAFAGRFNLPENTQIIVVAAIIGILAGLGAVALREMIFLFQRLGYGVASPTIAFVQGLPFWLKIPIPAAGGLGVGLITRFFAPEAKGHGVPEVMESVAVRGGMIRRRVSIAKAVASAMTIGTGGSTGREGPIIQIGASIGSTIGRFFGLSAGRVKVFVASGAAAGIAAAFNAPIAGAIFAAEVILADFAVPRLAPIVVASVASTAVSRLIIGDETAFVVPEYQLLSAWEFAPYLVLGVLCGLAAILFIRSLYRIEDVFDRSRIPPIVRPAIGGLVIGVISLFLPHVLGTGYEGITDALLGEGTWYLLLGLMLAKLVATTVTLGSGGSGGIFAPSLFIGATLGGAWGHLVGDYFPSATGHPGAYALVGMGGLVAGATHAPITAILILFEMTGSYSIILPLMFTCVGSVLVSSRVHRESIYTEKLKRRGLDIHAGRDRNLLRAHKVAEVLRDDAATLRVDASMAAMTEKVVEGRHPQFFVIDGADRLHGIIHAAEIRSVLFDTTLGDIVIAGDLAEPCALRLYPDDTLDQAMRLFGQSSLDELPVIDPSNGERFVGVVTREDCISTYNRAVAMLDVAEEMAAASRLVDRVNEVKVSEGYLLLEFEAPIDFYDRSLEELALPTNHGVQVVMILRRGEDGKDNAVLPRAGVVIRPGDIVLVGGPPEAVRKFKRV